jgi:hypothetical protein
MHVRTVADCALKRVQPPASDDDGVPEVVKAVSEGLADARTAAGNENCVAGRLHQTAPAERAPPKYPQDHWSRDSDPQLAR